MLKIVQESEGVVQAGASLIEIGDPLDLEIVADLLSTDAVRIKQGAPVWIDTAAADSVEIPRLPSGKVLRRVLRERAMSACAKSREIR